MSRRLSTATGHPVASCDQPGSALVELAQVTGMRVLGKQGAVISDFVHIDGRLVTVGLG